MVGDRTDDFVGDDTLAATRAYLVKAMHSKSTENYADARVYYERGIHATVTAANKPGYMQLREPSALEDVNATGRRLRWGLVETLTALGETDVARHEMFEAFMHERNNAGKLRIGESYRKFVSWCLSKQHYRLAFGDEAGHHQNPLQGHSRSGLLFPLQGPREQRP